MFSHPAVERIEHITLVKAPFGSDCQVSWSVTGQPVDDNVRGHLLQQLNQKRDIILQGIGRIPFRVPRKIRSSDDMELVKLDAERMLCVQITDAGQVLFCSFMGQADDHMYNHRDPGLGESAHGILETGERVPSPDQSGSGLVNRLESQFHPDEFTGMACPEFPEHPDAFLADTVGSRGDGYPCNGRLCQTLGELAAQNLRGSVGIGKGLEISNETSADMLISEFVHAVP